MNDINEELINVYQVIRDNPDELLSALATHENSDKYYYKIRNYDRETIYDQYSDIERASRIIYLNKTCYNGLFRVNNQGQFNAPYGRYKSPNIINEEVIRAVSEYLNRASVEFRNGGFREAVADAGKGSFVYFDPPYDPVSATSSFTGYALDGFTRADQQKLKETCDELTMRQVKFLLSNSATPYIRELYKDYNVEIVEVARPINSEASKRGKVEEVLISNY